jgi:hypothetical protein
MGQLEKQISIVVAASGEIKDIAVTEGATVGEVMKEANLVGYQLTRKGGELLTSETDIYSTATDLEKFYATPEDVSVGVGGSAPRATLTSIRSKVGAYLRRKHAEAGSFLQEMKESDVNRHKKKECYL